MLGITKSELAVIESQPMARVSRHTRHLGVLPGGLTLCIEPNKLRKLIDIAVRYRGRLSALKNRELDERLSVWQMIEGSSESNNTRESGDRLESFWRNKSLFVRRVSRKEEHAAGFLPQFTEIACVISGGAKVLLTIFEKDHQARFDVISASGKSGYCLEGLDNNLELTEILNLLAEIEGA